MKLTELLRRYDRPGPRYTSYPTAVEFHEGVDAAAYERHLAAAAGLDAPLSFYIHLPFCEERCLFCGCNVVITKQRAVAQRYLDHLHDEIRALARRLGPRRRLSQYHWGGGTPTYLTSAEMRELQSVVTAEFEIEPDAEVAIEVDPRVTTAEQMETLGELGFGRLSLGVQDFTLEVQEAVNRVQSYEQTSDLVERARGLGFRSINLDLIYGLPFQTPATFRQTLDQVATIRPDRVAVYSFAHVPWMKGHQRKIPDESLPTPATKLELFASAVEVFSDAGYLSIGMDHFALPEDEMGRALKDGTLWRNFMGYTVRHAPDMVACGMSGIGDVGGAYFQNQRKLIGYESAGGFPIERGYVLSDDDQRRRHVITSLMCTCRARRPGFWERFAPEREQLAPLVDDGFVEIHDDGLEVVGQGRFFIRNVCMAFDAYLGKSSQQFSRTV